MWEGDGPKERYGEGERIRVNWFMFTNIREVVGGRRMQWLYRDLKV